MFHVEMLFVDRGWFARFSRANFVTVGASATNDRCEGILCEFDSKSASCFVSLFSLFHTKSLLDIQHGRVSIRAHDLISLETRNPIPEDCQAISGMFICFKREQARSLFEDDCFFL